jgi:ATP-dependent helicase/nuclease subunit B
MSAAMAARPNLFTVPPGVTFLPTLVDALLDGRLVPGFAPRGDPLALASVTLYLPTRRAIRAIRRVFLDGLGGEAAILPRLLALGEVDDEEPAVDAEGETLPGAIGELERQLGLTRLILGWSEGLQRALLPVPGEDEALLIPSSPGDAAGLARDLAHFMDGLAIDGVPFEALAKLADSHEGRYARYWDLTLTFLAIAGEAWPAHLAEQGLVEPIERRNRLLAIESARIAAGTMPGPVIVAGSTGSVAATRGLIAAVAASRLGAVVLPGLDQGLDAVGWDAIDGREATPGHPQATMKALLAAMGVEDRAEVVPLGAVPPDLRLRARLVSEALRPATTTDLWRRPGDGDRAAADQAFGAVTLIEAANEGEEALAIALVLREALETPSRCAALVTPDRGLAARVVAELGRWGVAADDSAGRPLMATPPGIFVRLVLDVALSDFAPVEVLALLKHPFATLGHERATLRRVAETLEVGALRGPQPPPGLDGLRQAIAAGRRAVTERHAHPLSRRIGEAEWAAAEALIDRLEAALGRFAALLRAGEAAAAKTFLAAHIEAVEAVAEGYANLYAQEAGRALEAFFADCLALEEDALSLPAVEYPGLFAALAGPRTVRGGEPKHPRIAIYGLLEARLLTIDRLVMGGLDEGLWPAEARLDPWLNRPMRGEAGLSLPEKRIGLAAHDFEQALGAPGVVVTRAVKRGGSPTVASRWLQRLEATLGETYRAMRMRGERWLDLVRRLDAPSGPVVPLGAPKPCPPRALRPTSLSVTEIEQLVRDPYSIYARRILRLEPLDPIAAAPGAADRGTLIHAAIERFAGICADGVPPDAEARLLAVGRELFAGFAGFPDVEAFWWPRFRRIAAFLAEFEARRRPAARQVLVETRGRLDWETPAGRSFTLTAKADRIEIGADGQASILDFKTGAAPTAPQIESGIAPQLALEGAMLLEGAFPEVKGAGLADLTVIGLGQSKTAFKDTPLAFRDASAAEICERALERLKVLIARFEDEATPYASLLHPMFKTRRNGDYDHLARVREWSLADDPGEDG